MDRILKLKMKKITPFFVLFALLILSGCADSQDVHECVSGHVYGFWGGLWHGIIAPFDFVGMLIWDDVAVYAPNNNGGWYAFGFCLGVGAFSSSVSQTSKRYK